MKKTTKQLLFERMESIGGMKNKPKFIIPVGISGSGKSTWIRSNTDTNTIIVSPDDIRRELTGNVSDQSRNNDIFPIAFKRAEDALNAGKNVIFDATNVSSFHRKKMLDTLKQNVDVDFTPQAKVFSVDPEIAKQRIKGDIEGGVDRSNVPDFAVDKQFNNYVSDLGSLESDGYEIIS